MQRSKAQTRRAFAALATIAILGACALQPPHALKPAAPRVTTLDGALANPLEGEARRLALLVFVEDGCPIARALSPEIERIGRDAIDAGVMVALVYPDPLSNPNDIRAHNREFGLTLPTLLDPSHALVDAVGATISPEAALIRHRADGGFDLLYRGRINDLFTAPGRRRPSATTNDLADALEAAFNGRAPEPARTTAVGCVIEPLPDR